MATQFTAVVFLRIVDFNTFAIALISVTHNKEFLLAKLLNMAAWEDKQQRVSCNIVWREQ